MSKAKGKEKPVRKAEPPKPTKAKKAPEAPKEEKPKAAKPKKVAAKKEAAPSPAKAAPVKLGPPPSAVVTSRHLDSTHERAARGFSFGELASASVPLTTARNGGLKLDIRRRSVVQGNVDSLKRWLSGQASTGHTPKKSQA